MMEKVYTIDDIEVIAKQLAGKLDKCKLFAFSGSLGAGKTTLISAILKQLKIDEPILSPTFNYVNIYKNLDGNKFYHFDLYRLSSSEDFLNAGFEEYLYEPGSWSFIEWPEIIKDILPKKEVCYINIDYHGFDKRCLKIRAT